VIVAIPSAAHEVRGFVPRTTGGCFRNRAEGETDNVLGSIHRGGALVARSDTEPGGAK
jgi:hypothetical protein